MDDAYTIAIELEHILSDKFGISDNDIRGTIFCASQIMDRMFYDDVILLLNARGNGADQDAFREEIRAYRQTNMANIPELGRLFDTFQTLID